MKENAAWVFGYGSLIYKADFPYLDRQPARIYGWERRFWQGSHDHRGMPHAPGRVVTLVPNQLAICEGVAYQVEHAVFDHLDHREKNGYLRVDTDVHFQNGVVTPGVTYIAAECNEAYLGEAPLAEVAAHIQQAHGPSGPNLEYLLLLADSLRELGIEDPHVFELEKLVKQTP